MASDRGLDGSASLERVKHALQELERRGVMQLAQRLTLYAARLLGTHLQSHAPDIVGEAFEKALAGDRIWLPELCPDFSRFMFGVVRSLSSQKRESATVRHEMPIHSGGGEPSSEETEADLLLPDDHPASNPALTVEIEQFNERILAQLAAREPILASVFLLMLYEGLTAEEAGEKLDVSPTAIRNTRKRLERALAEVRRSWGSLPPGVRH